MLATLAVVGAVVGGLVLLVLLYLGGTVAVAVIGGWREGWREGTDDAERAIDAEERAEHEAELARHGLLPQDRQRDTWAGPPAPALVAALDQAKAGTWQAAAALLARTAADRDWEFRSLAAYELGAAAAEDDAWLLDWEAARPDDPHAAVVRARSTVVLAWRVRGAKRARHTSGEQFEGFHRVLRSSLDDISRAAALNPDDPTPHITAIWAALGLGAPQADMDRIWKEVTARAPHHYEAHFSALQFWCAKWRGSEPLAKAFAADAARRAPAGSLLTALPLIAHFEHDDSDTTEADNTPEMRAAVDAALADVAAAELTTPHHPRLPELRHLLAFYLHLQERDAEAIAQFRTVDGHVDALPWRYRGDPVAYYCQVRDESLRLATRA